MGDLVRGVGSPPWRLTMGLAVAAPLVVISSAAFVLSQEVFLREAGEFWRSSQDRAEIIGKGLTFWRQSPWLGIGLNEFRAVYVANPSYVPHAHNIFCRPPWTSA